MILLSGTAQNGHVDSLIGMKSKPEWTTIRPFVKYHLHKHPEEFFRTTRQPRQTLAYLVQMPSLVSQIKGAPEGTRWTGHTLIRALAGVPRPVDIYLKFEVWDLGTKAYRALEVHLL